MKDLLGALIIMLSKRNSRKTAIALLVILATVMFGQDVGLAIQNAAEMMSQAVTRV